MVPSRSGGNGYRIPAESTVASVITEILEDALTVRSQTRFHKLVLGRLKERNGGKFRLSAERLRRIAARMENVDLIIHCREGSRTSRKSICPVCGIAMGDIKNSTLYGWTVSTGKYCSVCGYWTGTHERIPTRYVFTVEKERYLGEKMKENGAR
ncbi:MAG: hypothetical protein ACMUIE_01555 [Thermoplasmatota archaeon]